MIRRRIVLIYWVVALALFIPNVAYAYIDPATTTYLIQIATALVVTIGVSLSVFLYKFRMISSKIKYWFYGLLYRSKSKDFRGTGNNNEDDASQETTYVLPEFVMPGADTSPEIASFSNNIRDALNEGKNISLAKKADAERIPQTYPEKLRAMIPLALAVAFSFIIIGCLELAMQFAPEIPFTVSSIVPYVLILFAVAFVLLIVIIPVFRGKLYEFLLVLVCAVLVAGYIQGNFLNRGLGQLTGDAVIWSDLKPQFAVSLICWIGCFVLFFFLWKKARIVWRKALIFVPFVVILLQGVSFISVINDNANDGVWGAGVYWRSADETLTIDQINEVASEQNAIIIVLDRLDQEYIEEIKVEDPDFFDPLDGFTEFDDYISYFGSTFPSVAGFLTGHRYEYDMPKPDYYNYAWGNADFLRGLHERGVDIRLYMDRGFAYSSVRQLGGMVSNVFEGKLGINERIALVKLLKLSGYRYAPMPLKQFFWFSPTEFIDTLELTDKTAPYMVDDFSYYKSLTNNGLSISDEGYAFIYIHLLGPHPPLNMDENIQYVEEASLIQQTKGSYKIVYEYLRQLKGLGLYEDSLIIIMGDHGNYLGDELERPARTALMVKPAGIAGTPMSISHAPVSPDQLHATLLEGLYGDSEGLGDTFMDVKEGADMSREYDINLHRYEIEGDGRDFSNWRFMGLFPDEYR